MKLFILGLSIVCLGACATPSVLVVALSKERGASVAKSVSDRKPELKGRKVKIEVVPKNDSQSAVKSLEWAEEHGVKYIGMDGGVVGPGDRLISPKLRELRRKGVFIKGVEFTENVPPADWPEILALAERATKCEQPKAPIITQSCFHQTNDEQPGLNISHKLDLSGPLRTMTNGQKLWDKKRLTLICGRATSSEATVWFFAYDLSGQIIQSYKARTPSDEKGGGLPQEDLPMDPDEAERIAAQELQYWRDWKKGSELMAPTLVK